MTRTAATPGLRVSPEMVKATVAFPKAACDLVAAAGALPTWHETGTVPPLMFGKLLLNMVPTMYSS